MTFQELGVRDDLLRAVEELGFETPMPVQEKVIPLLLTGDRDLVALAELTGAAGENGRRGTFSGAQIPS